MVVKVVDIEKRESLFQLQETCMIADRWHVHDTKWTLLYHFVSCGIFIPSREMLLYEPID
jgi:hypothetical protein